MTAILSVTPPNMTSLAGAIASGYLCIINIPTGEIAGTYVADVDKLLTFITSNLGTAALEDVGAFDASGLAAAAETAAKAYADALVVGLWDDRGTYNASGNVYPSAGGSGVSGAILKGDIWTISAAGTLGSNTVEVGDTVRALIDSPGSTNANWAVGQNNIGWVPENAANKSTSLSSPNNTTFPTTLAVSDAIASAKIESIIVACSDRTTALTAGTNKFSFPVPYDFTLTAIKGYLTTAQASGAIFTVDINQNGSTILSTKLTIDNTEQNSVTAVTQPVISNVNLTADSEVIFDFDQVGDGTAKGLIITFIGTRA